MIAVATWLATLAHVKWFAEVRPPAPHALGEVIGPWFVLGAMLTLAVTLALTWLNQPLQELSFVRRIHGELDQLRPFAQQIIRIGMAIPLVAAGAGGYLLHYELTPVPQWVHWLQILAGLLLLLPLGAPKIGAGAALVVYLAGVAFFGLHHMVDYIAWVGACLFVLARGTRAAGAAIPVLYITTGVSLAWAAAEKWFFPGMGLEIIVRNQIPTFGFPPDLFLMLSGWIEFGVAYLLITGVLNRFLSLVLSLLFVLTSTLFGAQEILGHWQLHATLLVFLAEGTGPYVTPALWPQGRARQTLFVGFLLLPFLGIVLWLYPLLA